MSYQDLETVGGKNSTKNLIINALRFKNDFTTKQIYFFLKKEFGLNSSYQSVHKALKELSSEKIVFKKNKKYFLNREWIQNNKMFFEELADKKVDLTRLENQTISLSFNSYHEFMDKMLDIFAKERELFPNNLCVTYQNHLYWTMSLSKNQYNKLKILGSHGGYIACNGNSFFDKVLATIYKKVGYDVKTGVNYSNNFDFVVYGNIIHQIFFSDKQKKEINIISKKSKKTEDIFEQGFHEKLFEKPGKINVVIFKNKELAEQLTNDVLKQVKN